MILGLSRKPALRLENQRKFLHPGEQIDASVDGASRNTLLIEFYEFLDRAHKPAPS